MTDYSRYRTIAKEKIAKYGNTVTIKRKGETVYNPTTNDYDTVEVEISGEGILSGIESQFINGTTILAGDSMLMCVLDAEPNINDKLTFGGVEYNVVNIEPLSPDGTMVIYYNIQLRK